MGNLLFPFSGVSCDTVSQTDPDCNYEEGRRKVLKYAQHTLRKSDKVRIIEKYIEIPSGHVLFSKCFIPLETKPKGCVFFLEGYATNTDRPDTHENCLRFAEAGYMVITHDHLGYGRSDGLWLYIPNSFDIDYVDNAHYIHDYCKKLYITDLTSTTKHNELYQFHDPSLFNNYNFSSDESKNNDNGNKNKLMPWDDLSGIDKDKKYFLCGRSMGGAVATRLAQKYPNDYSGLMLVCPMIKIDETLKPPKWVLYIFKLLASWFPKKTWTPAAGDMHDFWVSNKANKHKLNTQTMKFKKEARLKTAFEGMEVTEIIQRDIELLTMDFIVLHGTEDKVTNPKSSEQLYENRKDKCDATLKLYDGGYHMLWWESCGDQYYSDLLIWLDDHCQKCGKQ